MCETGKLVRNEDDVAALELTEEPLEQGLKGGAGLHVVRRLVENRILEP